MGVFDQWEYNNTLLEDLWEESHYNQYGQEQGWWGIFEQFTYSTDEQLEAMISALVAIKTQREEEK